MGLSHQLSTQQRFQGVEAGFEHRLWGNEEQHPGTGKTEARARMQDIDGDLLQPVSQQKPASVYLIPQVRVFKATLCRSIKSAAHCHSLARKACRMAWVVWSCWAYQRLARWCKMGTQISLRLLQLIAQGFGKKA